MRLNRYLASCGLGSRRSVESLITEGRVRVNGRDCLDLGTRISDGDRVEVNGEEIKPRQELSVIFHKPRGFETTRKGKSKEPTVYDLLPNHFRDLHHVGRLDKQSEGLLLFTNSGDLSQQLLHPRHQVEKEYEVVIDRPLRDGDRAKLRAGIRLKEGLARAERIDILSRRRFHMILTQGWNRQIRR
ncbi:MAG: pseudouridine synthase, partial [Verrucomicrobiota bacterium]